MEAVNSAVSFIIICKAGDAALSELTPGQNLHTVWPGTPFIASFEDVICPSHRQVTHCQVTHCQVHPLLAPTPMLWICPQVERIHESGSRDGLATAIMEHANTLVSLAGALYAMQRFPAAVEAYEQSLVVFELVEDVDRITKVLLNLHNMAEIQVRASAVLEVKGKGG